MLSDSVSRMSSSTHFARYSEPSDWYLRRQRSAEDVHEGHHAVLVRGAQIPDHPLQDVFRSMKDLYLRVTPLRRAHSRMISFTCGGTS